MTLTNTVTESFVHDLPFPSLALPLIANLTYAILMMILVVVEVVVIGDVLGIVDVTRIVTEAGELSPHLVASDTVGVKGLIEVINDQTLQVEVGSTLPILNALDRC